MNLFAGLLSIPFIISFTLIHITIPEYCISHVAKLVKYENFDFKGCISGKINCCEYRLTLAVMSMKFLLVTSMGIEDMITQGEFSCYLKTSPQYF